MLIHQQHDLDIFFCCWALASSAFFSSNYKLVCYYKRSSFNNAFWITFLHVMLNKSSTPSPVFAELVKNSSPCLAASSRASSCGTAIFAYLSILFAISTLRTPYSAFSLICFSQLVIETKVCLEVQSYTIKTPAAPL